MTVVGAGVIGVEYASMFGALGTKVTVVDQRDRVLSFLDSEIGEAFQYLLRRRNVTFRLREKVDAVEALKGRGARLKLASGKEIVSETVLYATGRQGDTDKLGLGATGLECDKRGRIKVDDAYRTAVPHIFAVGDVAGGAGLAATAMEQGRIAALHAFDQPVTQLPQLIPYGVYAIPELAMVGCTEEQLTDDAVPYVAGMARFSELARGVISGDRDGILKLLVSPEDRSVLGVHVLGTSATDLVHIGQAVMAAGAGGLDFLVTAVFNYPTFAESYKVAALDADNRIKAMKALRENETRAARWPPLIKGRERVKFRPRRPASWPRAGVVACSVSHWLMIAASARSRSVRVAAIDAAGSGGRPGQRRGGGRSGRSHA